MDTAESIFPFLFPVFFVTLWLVVTTVLAFLSGWVVLAKAFPDRDETPLLRLSAQSGSMGLGVHMRGILKLSVCPSGLRVGIMRVFGPFSRDFFVPWKRLSVTRERSVLMAAAKLEFGGVGKLTIPAFTANCLARVAGKNWPEQGPFPAEEPRQTGSRLLLQWALVTGLASLFFIGAPLLLAPKGEQPPVVAAILFPATVFGVGFAVRFFRERKQNRSV